MLSSLLCDDVLLHIISYIPIPDIFNFVTASPGPFLTSCRRFYVLFQSDEFFPRLLGEYSFPLLCPLKMNPSFFLNVFASPLQWSCLIRRSLSISNNRHRCGVVRRSEKSLKEERTCFFDVCYELARAYTYRDWAIFYSSVIEDSTRVHINRNNFLMRTKNRVAVRVELRELPPRPYEQNFNDLYFMFGVTLSEPTNCGVNNNSICQSKYFDGSVKDQLHENSVYVHTKFSEVSDEYGQRTKLSKPIDCCSVVMEISRHPDPEATTCFFVLMRIDGEFICRCVLSRLLILGRGRGDGGEEEETSVFSKLRFFVATTEESRLRVTQIV